MIKKNNLIFYVTGLIILIVALFIIFNQTNIEDNALSEIKEREKIIIGTSADFPPMESIDENGEYIGYDIDFAKEIADALEVKLEIKDITFDELITSLNNKEIDIIIAALTITPERSQIVDFSNPYDDFGGQIIVVKSDEMNIIEAKDLKNKKVGVQKGTTQVDVAEEYGSIVIEYESHSTLPQELINKNIDAFIADINTANELVKQYPELKTTGSILSTEYSGVAVRKGQILLLTEINNVIKDLRETGKLVELRDKWLIK